MSQQKQLFKSILIDFESFYYYNSINKIKNKTLEQKE